MTLVVENVKIATAELRANPFRSALTTLGIIIAVSAVIAVVSIVHGASKFMINYFESLGSNSFYVFGHRPQGDAGRRLGHIQLTVEDALAIEGRCSAVAAASPVTELNGAIVWHGAESTARVHGTVPSFQRTRNVYVDDGRIFSPVDVEHRENLIVLGDETIKELNTTRAKILGETVRLRGEAFKVCGFLEHKGSAFGESQDDMALIPISTAAKIWGSWRARHVMIIAQAKPGQTAEAVDQATWLLRLRHNRHGGDPDDFKIFTQDQFIDGFRQFSLMITGLLFGIVGVSLLVGGVGIMNIMLVSVSERTREIGVRKALGAKNRDILSQFLIEAITLAVLGGLFGLLLGYLGGLLAREAISVWVDFPPVYVPPWAVMLSLSFSAAVGLISGLYPAWKAARLDPIEALRYE
ncbi:ABC transporter permease [bacterium]|nr:ABC transporter permease [bacterium]